MTIVGSQTGANEAGDKLYPARMRANGLGWALGIGRLGGIAGPALGGDLLAPGLRPPIIFLSACGFILGAAVATALLRFREERVESLTISWPTIPTSITRGLARPEERRSPTRSGKRPASGFDYTLYSQLTLAGPEVRIHLPPAKSQLRTRYSFKRSAGEESRSGAPGTDPSITELRKDSNRRSFSCS
ncbi:MAG TPA: hypothetical protein VHT00_08255 [Stellaceae bacterium]|nr:hypothetical protein [Stellaceae bacterium]